MDIITIAAIIGAVAVIALLAIGIPKLAHRVETVDAPRALGEATLAAYHADQALVASLRQDAVRASAEADAAATALVDLKVKIGQ